MSRKGGQGRTEDEGVLVLVLVSVLVLDLFRMKRRRWALKGWRFWEFELIWPWRL